MSPITLSPIMKNLHLFHADRSVTWKIYADRAGFLIENIESSI